MEPTFAMDTAPSLLSEAMVQRLAGNCYRGATKDQLPHGEGECSFADGVVYRGGFYEGMLHGSGLIIFSNSSHFTTQWHLNSLLSASYFFPDALAYPTLTSPFSTTPSSWSFCTDADRRFATELTRGIQLAPLGESQLTPHPDRALPFDCYDVGDGYLDPATAEVWAWDGRALVRQADPVEVQWAQAKCRVGRDESFTHAHHTHSDAQQHDV